jgi:hypothetical protein
MTTYNYTEEQRDKIVELLLKIQMNINNSEIIDTSVKDIYKIIYSEQPKTTRKIYNPITGKCYIINERSGIYDGNIKGLWRKKDE